VVLFLDNVTAEVWHAMRAHPVNE